MLLASAGVNWLFLDSHAHSPKLEIERWAKSGVASPRRKPGKNKRRKQAVGRCAEDKQGQLIEASANCFQRWVGAWSATTHCGQVAPPFCPRALRSGTPQSSERAPKHRQTNPGSDARYCPSTLLPRLDLNSCFLLLSLIFASCDILYHGRYRNCGYSERASRKARRLLWRYVPLLSRPKDEHES